MKDIPVLFLQIAPRPKLYPMPVGKKVTLLNSKEWIAKMPSITSTHHLAGNLKKELPA